MNQLSTMERPQTENAIFDPGAFAHMAEVAAMLVDSEMLPSHLRGIIKQGKMVQTFTREKQIATAFVVINAARRLQADIFAFAQETFVIHGKLDFNGKVYSSLANAHGNLAERLRYEYIGDGPKMMCVCVGRFAGESEPRRLQTPSFADCAKQGGTAWNDCNPEQQLSYYAARAWVRRYCPEVLLGLVRDADEYPEEPAVSHAIRQQSIGETRLLEKASTYGLHIASIENAQTVDELLALKPQIAGDDSLAAGEREEIKVTANRRYNELKPIHPAESNDPSEVPDWEFVLGDNEVIIAEHTNPDEIKQAFDRIETCDGMPPGEVKRVGKIMRDRLTELAS